MAPGAVDLGLLRIIETASTVSGDAAQQEGVIMILASEKVFILGQFDRQADLMAGGAELRAFVQRLEECLFVEIGFAFDKLLIDELKEAIGAESEWIMNRLVNGVIGVAAGAVDVVDGMAGGAGNSRLGSGMFFQLEIRIIKSAAEKRDDIMAAGAPARSFHIPIALEGHLPGFAHAEQISFVIEGAKMMGAVKPAFIRVGMALQAIVVHHHRFGRDEVSAGSAGQ